MKKRWNTLKNKAQSKDDNNLSKVDKPEKTIKKS